MTYQGLNLSLIFRVAPLVSLPHHLVADLCEFASLQPCHAGVFCCQVFVYVSHPLLPVLFIPSGSLCRAEAEKVWEENRGLVGLPPCAECEVAAKRLWTGRALSICWRKMPHIEKVSEILWKKERGLTGRRVHRCGACVYVFGSLCSSCIMILIFPYLMKQPPKNVIDTPVMKISKTIAAVIK